tara:strand:+ start:210 stop:893 length:684 start_codon:yes stop_codon:yes gene_type:complete
MIVKNINAKIDIYKKLKRDFKIRKSPNLIELVLSDGFKMYHNRNKKFAKGLFLFNMVKTNVVQFIDSYGEVKPYEELPVNYSNPLYDLDNKTIGIDLNHAYWRVAYLKGYINETTYKKGLTSEELKHIRLSTLSTLGKARVYEVYEKGKYIRDEVFAEDIQLQQVYNDIRYSTYAVMYECSEILKNDFKSWKTDCIFFKDTKANRKLVTDLLDEYNLEYKYQTKGIV